MISSCNATYSVTIRLNNSRRTETTLLLPEDCRCLRLCVCPFLCVSVNPELVRAKTHHAFKLEPLSLDKRCKTTWLRSLLFLGDDWPSPSRYNVTWKAKFTPFWACPCHNLPSNQARTTKFTASDASQQGYCPFLFCGAIDRDLHGQIQLVNWLIKPSLCQDRDLCYTRDRHPICALSRTVAARCFFCSANPLRLRELYLLLRLPCCASTHSIKVDLIK